MRERINIEDAVGRTIEGISETERQDLLIALSGNAYVSLEAEATGWDDEATIDECNDEFHKLREQAVIDLGIATKDEIDAARRAESERFRARNEDRERAEFERLRAKFEAAKGGGKS